MMSTEPNSGMSFEKEPTPAGAASWREVLSELLVRGHTLDDAVAATRAFEVPEEDVRAEGRGIASHPLFGIASTIWVRLQCREWMFAAYARLGKMTSEISSLATVDSVSAEVFLKDYYQRNRPLLLRGVAREWPAVRQWNRSYLSAVCGDESVEIMANRAGALVSHQNTSGRLRKTMSFREYVDLVYTGGPSNDYYLVSRNRFFEQPGTRVLLDDVGLLSFVNTRAEGDGVKMWFGPAGTITPLHYDDKNNLIVQIAGSKDVRLYAPCFAEYMHQSQRWYAGIDPHDYVLPEGTEEPAEIRLTLQPGDALFIPVGWWHAVYAIEISITLAMIDFGVPNGYAAR